MKKSSRVHFPTIEVEKLGEDTFRVLKRSSYQINGNPSYPFHNRLGKLV
jgi:hypothetical protein